jgi:hypothetical protein
MTGLHGGPKRVAVLIDADNLPPRVLDDAMNAAKTHGSIIVACAYREWTDATRKGWNAGCQKHGIRCVEQAPGPNATDIALAIDAVDLLRDRGLDVICVVSSDRDFAPLAARLRRSGLTAVLMADSAKVKDSDSALWDAFVALEVARKKSARSVAPPAPAKPAGVPQPVNVALIEAVLTRLANEKVKKDADGWALLNEIGKGIPPDLKKPSLRKAIGMAEAIEVEDRRPTGKANATLWIRRRPGRT